MPSRVHLRRLTQVWVENPLYFITQSTEGRRPILQHPASADFLRDTLIESDRRHGWAVGKYVIMPDHVHFFARPRPGAKPLSGFMRDWKRWTSREILAEQRLPAPLWQAEFFDHVLRSAASYAEKCDYVRQNPVRAGLVKNPEEWTYGGEIHLLSF